MPNPYLRQRVIIAGQAAEAKKRFKGATPEIKHLELADSHLQFASRLSASAVR